MHDLRQVISTAHHTTSSVGFQAAALKGTRWCWLALTSSDMCWICQVVLLRVSMHIWHGSSGTWSLSGGLSLLCLPAKFYSENIRITHPTQCPLPYPPDCRKNCLFSNWLLQTRSESQAYYGVVLQKLLIYANIRAPLA